MNPFWVDIFNDGTIIVAGETWGRVELGGPDSPDTLEPVFPCVAAILIFFTPGVLLKDLDTQVNLKALSNHRYSPSPSASLLQEVYTESPYSQPAEDKDKDKKDKDKDKKDKDKDKKDKGKDKKDKGKDKKDKGKDKKDKGKDKKDKGKDKKDKGKDKKDKKNEKEEKQGGKFSKFGGRLASLAKQASSGGGINIGFNV